MPDKPKETVDLSITDVLVILVIVTAWSIMSIFILESVIDRRSDRIEQRLDSLITVMNNR